MTPYNTYIRQIDLLMKVLDTNGLDVDIRELLNEVRECRTKLVQADANANRLGIAFNYLKDKELCKKVLIKGYKKHLKLLKEGRM